MTDAELDEIKEVFREALREVSNIGIRAINILITVAEEKKDGNRMKELLAKRKVAQNIPQLIEPQITKAKTLQELLNSWPRDTFRAPI